MKVRKRAKIRNRYNQTHTWPRIPIGKLVITNESQELSPFRAGDQKGSNFSCYKFEQKSLQKSTVNQILLNEIVVLNT